MFLSELQNKEIIDLESGKKIGSIIDVFVLEDGSIKSLMLNDRGRRKFSLKEEYEVLWSQIVKIGDDIILVSGNKVK